MKRPCDPKDAIYFDYGNLVKFLEFIDFNQIKSQNDVLDIRKKLMMLDELQERLKESNSRIDVHSKKIEGIDTTIYNHQMKILEFDTNYRYLLEVYHNLK